MKYLLLFSLALAGSLCAGEPETRPVLRIEAGIHAAPIKRIAADTAGRLVLTASDDKTLCMHR